MWTFDTQIAMANRGLADAPVTVTFLKEDGTTVMTALTVPAARARRCERRRAGMMWRSFAIVVTSDEGVPLSVERTMTWDGGHGAHTGTAAEGLSPVGTSRRACRARWIPVLVANPGDMRPT